MTKTFHLCIFNKLSQLCWTVMIHYPKPLRTLKIATKHDRVHSTRTRLIIVTQSYTNSTSKILADGPDHCRDHCHPTEKCEFGGAGIISNKWSKQICNSSSSVTISGWKSYGQKQLAANCAVGLLHCQNDLRFNWMATYEMPTARNMLRDDPYPLECLSEME